MSEKHKSNTFILVIRDEVRWQGMHISDSNKNSAVIINPSTLHQRVWLLSDFGDLKLMAEYLHLTATINRGAKKLHLIKGKPYLQAA